MTNGTRRGWGVSVTPWPLFTPGKDPVPIVQEAGWAPGPVWTGAENLASPPGFGPRTVQPVASHYTDWATRPTLRIVTTIVLHIPYCYGAIRFIIAAILLFTDLTVNILRHHRFFSVECDISYLFWLLHQFFYQVFLSKCMLFVFSFICPIHTLTEVFPCFFLSCKANARVKPTKTGHGPHSS